MPGSVSITSADGDAEADASAAIAAITGFLTGGDYGPGARGTGAISGRHPVAYPAPTSAPAAAAAIRLAAEDPARVTKAAGAIYGSRAQAPAIGDVPTGGDSSGEDGPFAAVSPVAVATADRAVPINARQVSARTNIGTDDAEHAGSRTRVAVSRRPALPLRGGAPAAVAISVQRTGGPIRKFHGQPSSPWFYPTQGGTGKDGDPTASISFHPAAPPSASGAAAPVGTRQAPGTGAPSRARRAIATPARGGA